MRQNKKRRWGRWLLRCLVIGDFAGIAIYGSYDYLYVRPQIAAQEERARRTYETELNRHRDIEQRLTNQDKADTGTKYKLMTPVDSPDE